MKDLQTKVISRYNDLRKKFTKREKEKTLPEQQEPDGQPKPEGVEVKLGWGGSSCGGEMIDEEAERTTRIRISANLSTESLGYLIEVGLHLLHLP